MKKLICTLTFLVLGMVGTLGISAHAAGLPVKDVVSFSYGDNEVAVLTQSGDVYVTNDVLSSNKDFIETDVTSLASLSETTQETLFMVKSNGTMSVAVSDIDGKTSLTNYHIDVKTIITINPFTYIDHNNNLICNQYFQKDYGTSTTVTSDVISFAQSEFKGYVLKNDNVLYLLNADFYHPTAGNTTFVMSDVHAIYSCHTNAGAAYALKNNGDLYYLASDLPIKVASNVKMENGFFPGSRAAAIINTSNQLYISIFDFDGCPTTLQGENVKTVAWGGDSGNSYYLVTNDGKAYSGNIFRKNDLWLQNTQSNMVGNCMAIGDIAFYFNLDGIYLNNKNDKYSPIYDFGSIVSVKRVSVSYSTSYYIFINSTGDVWAADWKLANTMSTTLGNKPTKLMINDKEVVLTLNLQTVNNRTMYPFRECLNAMGASVMWDSENKIAIGELPGYRIEFPIGKSEYWVNGIKHEMDAGAYVDPSIGSTYIPLRYAAEGLGFTVKWIEGNTENTITISK
jgi:hypothetical protein